MSRHLRFLLVAALWLPVACRSAPREQPDETQVKAPDAAPAPATGHPPPTGAPVISALVPDSVHLAPNTISEIVVRGTGFAAGGTNTVRIGPIVLRNVSANAAGTEIRLVVPNRYSTNAEAPPRPLFPGSYPISVETGGLTSNAVMLKVLS